jgi:hypothetical protein
MTPTAASRVAASLARVASLAACPARCSRVSANRAPRPAGGRRWLLVDRQPHLDPRRARAADPPGPPRPPRQAPQGRPILGVPERRAAGSDARQAGQRRRQGELWAAQPDIEPVFGQLKTVQGARRFMRRGLGACEAEWKLLCGTHNLLINRPSRVGQAGAWDWLACFRRRRWPSRLAMTRVWRATSEFQPRSWASSRSARTSSSCAWSWGRNWVVVTKLSPCSQMLA